MVRALALVHHSLSNKEALSAHILRNIIKMIDAPTFPLSWAIIDSETDANQMVRRLEIFPTRLGPSHTSSVRLADTARYVVPHFDSARSILLGIT